MAASAIVQEIHKVREEYALKYGNDLKAICEAARIKQASSGHKIVNLAPKVVMQVQPDNARA